MGAARPAGLTGIARATVRYGEILMRSRGLAWRALAAALAVIAVTIPLACGDDGNSGSGDSAATGSSTMSGRDEAPFDPPEPSGRSLRGLLGGLPGGPVVAPAVSVLKAGENRFGFGLFDRGNRQIGGLKVALYVSRGIDERAHGPYHATYEPIEVESEYISQNSSQDPDSAKSLYVAQVKFPRAGGYVVAAVTDLGNRLVAAQPAQVRVGSSRVPEVGDRAPRVHTPTVASVGGDIDKIETRVPPDSMHEVDLADALDKGRPVVVLFSSPALCESRVCGPVTDLAEQVKSEFEGKADFIHVEFYKDNQLSKGPVDAARAYGLDAEPFLFTIDSDGIVAARLQGAYSADELRDAVRKALN
jgi:thioredoxin family protein